MNELAFLSNYFAAIRKSFGCFTSTISFNSSFIALHQRIVALNQNRIIRRRKNVLGGGAKLHFRVHPNTHTHIFPNREERNE